jgi:chemotaxis protein methyltransferase CheR
MWRRSLENGLGTEILSPGEFEQITHLASQVSGIDLQKNKQELVQMRVGNMIRQGRFGSFQEYYRSLVADRTGEQLIALLDALTTNFTSFLREPAHFDFLRQTILPSIEGPIRIWSAACSTGEEPLSIACSIFEELGLQASDRLAILATDLSTRVLAAARRAAYPAASFQGVAPDLLRRYLLKGSGSWEGWYRVKEAVRERIEFRRLNLMEPFHHQRRFHAIFCRNVMIYFNKSTQAALVNRFAPCLEPGGYLLIGHSETLSGLQHPYEYVRPAVYRKPL